MPVLEHSDRSLLSGALRLLVAGFAIELAVAHAADEGIPLCRSEIQDRASWVLAVANENSVVCKA